MLQHCIAGGPSHHRHADTRLTDHNGLQCKQCKLSTVQASDITDALAVTRTELLEVVDEVVLALLRELNESDVETLRGLGPNCVEGDFNGLTAPAALF